MARMIICPDCGREKAHYAKGICKPCYMRCWREENPGYCRDWRVQNSDRVRNYEKKHYALHAEREREEARQWYWANREKARAKNRRWQQESPEKTRANNARRRAHKRQVSNTLTQEQIDFEMNIAGVMWPDEDLHLHHIVPISKGGGHTWGNIMVIPAALNCSIGDKLPEEIYSQEALWQP